MNSKDEEIASSLLKKNECWSKDTINPEKICTPSHILKALAKILNINSHDNEEILKKSKEKLNCKSEKCVLNTKKNSLRSYINDEDLSKAINKFKKEGPAYTEDWLSNFDIDETLKKIEYVHKNEGFFAIPFQMRDFHENKPSENSPYHIKDKNLSTIDLCDKYLNQDYKCFGVVINTDYSTGTGIHWFCLFIDMRDLKNITIEYFNSTGNEPLLEISSWMKKVKYQIMKNNEILKRCPELSVKDIIVSKMEHQTDDHSCGVYSLYYIICRVCGVSYDYFKRTLITENIIKKFREAVFISKKEATSF